MEGRSPWPGDDAHDEFYELVFESLTLDRQGRLSARRPGRGLALALPLGEDVLLELVVIPGGQFLMGSSPGAGYPDEQPEHSVRVEPFLMGRYPVTQEQWASVMGELPACRFPGPRRPVENVSWREAAEFCRRLTAKTGRRCGLPSEAQWEYACRAGTRTPFSCGMTITSDLANYVGEVTYAGEPPGVYRHGTTEVGAFPPNPLGLYDLHGQLWEFCADDWRLDYREEPGDGSGETKDAAPPAAPVTDQAWQAGRPSRFRVARGGSWHDGPGLCRSAARLRIECEHGDDIYGLRLAAAL